MVIWHKAVTINQANEDNEQSKEFTWQSYACAGGIPSKS